MYLVRYQCVSYRNLGNEPLGYDLSFENSGLHWFRAQDHHYYAVWVSKRPYQGTVSLSNVETAQSCLDYANDNLCVVNGCVGDLEAVDPIGVLLFAETENELSAAGTVIIEKPIGIFPPFVSHHCSVEDMRAVYLEKARQDFLAECEKQGLGRGKLTSYVRLFEAAFALSGDKLKKALHEFLNSGQCDYPKEEISKWISIRGGLSHADRRKNWINDRNAWRYIPRIRQAAYDVTFNKKHWHKNSTQRENRVPLHLRIKPDSGMVVDIGFKFEIAAFHLDTFRQAFVRRDWAKNAGLPQGIFPDMPVVEYVQRKFGTAGMIRFECK